MTAHRKHKYVDPILLSKLKNMSLVARCAVEGFFTGMHPSPFHGFSVDYSDHQAYQAGDDPKYLDWKMYGRSRKLYIKQFLQETNLTAYIMLDDVDDVKRGLAHLKYLKHDVILFHLMDRQELELDYEGLVQFEDLDTHEQVEIDRCLAGLSSDEERSNQMDRATMSNDLRRPLWRLLAWIIIGLVLVENLVVNRMKK
jgi:hypothetical protein